MYFSPSFGSAHLASHTRRRAASGGARWRSLYGTDITGRAGNAGDKRALVGVDTPNDLGGWNLTDGGRRPSGPSPVHPAGGQSTEGPFLGQAGLEIGLGPSRFGASGAYTELSMRLRVETGVTERKRGVVAGVARYTIRPPGHSSQGRYGSYAERSRLGDSAPGISAQNEKMGVISLQYTPTLSGGHLARSVGAYTRPTRKPSAFGVSVPTSKRRRRQCNDSPFGESTWVQSINFDRREDERTRERFRRAPILFWELIVSVVWRHRAKGGASHSEFAASNIRPALTLRGIRETIASAPIGPRSKP